jgi:hypothetical protein
MRPQKKVHRITAKHATHIRSTGAAVITIPMSDITIVAIEMSINGVSTAIAAMSIINKNKQNITMHATIGNGIVAKNTTIDNIMIHPISIADIMHTSGTPTTTTEHIIHAKTAINTASAITIAVSTPLVHKKQHSPIRETIHIPARGSEHSANSGHITVARHNISSTGVYIANSIDIPHSAR